MGFSRFLKPKNYLKKIIFYLNRIVISAIDITVSPSEKLPLKHPAIFILGAPRSGSTILIQAITSSFDFAYISNLHCRWFGSPALLDSLIKSEGSVSELDFDSYHGITYGDSQPAECGEWWYRFFRRRPAYVELNETNKRKMRNFRRSIAAFVNSSDKPIVFKNLYASLRIKPIVNYIPEALFIVVHRNELDNGHSILESRFKVCADYSKWWSMEPPNIENISKLPPHEQVIEQIRGIYKTIDDDLSAVNLEPFRRIDVDYERFCQNTEAILSELEKFFKYNGCSVSRKGFIPSSFTMSSSIRIDSRLYQDMKNYVQNS